jgi:hypothetical protein
MRSRKDFSFRPPPRPIIATPPGSKKLSRKGVGGGGVGGGCGLRWELYIFSAMNSSSTLRLHPAAVPFCTTAAAATRKQRENLPFGELGDDADSHWARLSVPWRSNNSSSHISTLPLCMWKLFGQYSFCPAIPPPGPHFPKGKVQPYRGGGEFINVKQLFRQRFDPCVNKLLMK